MADPTIAQKKKMSEYDRKMNAYNILRFRTWNYKDVQWRIDQILEISRVDCADPMDLKRTRQYLVVNLLNLFFTIYSEIM